MTSSEEGPLHAPGPGLSNALSWGICPFCLCKVQLLRPCPVLLQSRWAWPVLKLAANCLSYQHISGQDQQMVQSQSFSQLVRFHSLLVLLTLGLTTGLLPLRHSTMAIGIAVDILGCTGTLEDRAATLNRIIQVAVELKDSMGDLYSFSAIMKALEMPQVNFHWSGAALRARADRTF